MTHALLKVSRGLTYQDVLGMTLPEIRGHIRAIGRFNRHRRQHRNNKLKGRGR